MIKKIRDYFLSGLLVVVPLGLTTFIIWWIFEKLDSLLKDLVAWLIRDIFHVTWIPLPIPGIGVAAIVILIFATGIFARNIFGRKLIELGDLILNRLPFVSKIYKPIQEISKVLLSDKKAIFDKPVLIEYPRKDIYCIGFYTRQASGDVADKTHKELLSIFLPTTPNPTSGFLLFLPKEDIIFLDMSIEDAMKIIVSGGVVFPENQSALIQDVTQLNDTLLEKMNKK